MYSVRIEYGAPIPDGRWTPHGDQAVEHRPLREGSILTVPVPTDYLAAIAAARTFAHSAASLMHGYARKARGEGRSWSDLATPLGIPDSDDDPAAAAFEAVSGPPPMPHDRVWTSWTCGTCGSNVVDYGPYNGHPADNERGHAENCVRHHAESAAYLARLNDDWD